MGTRVVITIGVATTHMSLLGWKRHCWRVGASVFAMCGKIYCGMVSWCGDVDGSGELHVRLHHTNSLREARCVQCCFVACCMMQDLVLMLLCTHNTGLAGC